MADKLPVSRWYVVTSVFPWFVAIAPYFEAATARIVLSRWPRPMVDDPKQLATAPLHLLFQLAFLFLAVVLGAFVVLSVINWKKFRRTGDT